MSKEVIEPEIVELKEYCGNCKQVLLMCDICLKKLYGKDKIMCNLMLKEHYHKTCFEKLSMISEHNKLQIED